MYSIYEVEEMYEHTVINFALPLFLLPAILMQAQYDVDASYNEKTDTPTIIVTKMNLSDKVLKLSYEIRNDTKLDLWIYEGPGKYNISADAFMDEDNQTLLIRSRLDLPAPERAETPSFDGGYVRLPSGEVLSESVSFPIPVRPRYVFFGERQERGLEFATRLAIEIGYYTGDLPEIIRDTLKEAKKIPRTKPIVYPIVPTTLIDFFGGLLGFNELNEGLRSRDEKVLIPYTDQILKGEHSLRIIIDGLRIPYYEEEQDSSIAHEPPDLTSCTKVEIRYHPSMLDYYFPYAGQQSLLSPEEIRYLRIVRTIVLEDKEDLKAIINDIGNGTPTIGGIIRERGVAYVVCYDGSKHLMSLPIYNNLDSLVDNEMYLFTRNDGFQSLKVVTPKIQLIELRIRCAANLKDLWNRFQLYDKAEKNRIKDSSNNDEIIYPPPTKWCDVMVAAFASIGMNDYWNMRPHICPSAGEGKCHYAMNPNCKPDSPPDTVLLFETKAGWNQHGGPKLFTFDNHEPKGGCVLLNDGTVKFIRTKEELQKLRWK